VTTWQEARTVATAAQAREVLLSFFAQATVRGWSASAPQRALIEGNAAAVAYETQLRAALAATASPNTAKAAGSTWVDAVMEWFDLDDGTGGKGRIKATKATWEVPLVVTASAAPLTIGPGTTVQLQAEDGTIFEFSQDSTQTLNAASSYRQVVRFTARKAGTTGNVNSGQITKVISGPAGLAVDLDGTQVLVDAARDAETDDQYIKRGLGRWGTLSVAGWTASSYDFLIPTAAPNVTRWKVEDDNPLGPGTTRVTLARAAGPASSGDVAAVDAYLANRSRKTLGNPPTIARAATTATVVLTGTVFSDGSNGNLLGDVNAALAILRSAFPIGGLESNPGKLELELLIGVLIGGAFEEYGIPGFRGASKRLLLSSPATDVSIGISDVLAFDTSGLEVG
jgi:predicted secreted protein